MPTMLKTDGTLLCDPSGATPLATTMLSLTGAMTDTVGTAVSLVTGGGINVVNGTIIQIDTERMLVVSGAPTDNLVVERGVWGTTAATHLALAVVHLPSVLTMTLLPSVQIPNQSVKIRKSTPTAPSTATLSDINFVLIQAGGTDVFPGGGTTRILPDSTESNGMVTITFPGAGTPRVLMVAGGSGAPGPAGASGGGGTPAPSVTATGSITGYQPWANATQPVFGGVITLPTSDSNYSHLKFITVEAISPPDPVTGTVSVIPLDNCVFDAPFPDGTITYSGTGAWILQTDTAQPGWCLKITPLNESYEPGTPTLIPSDYPTHSLTIAAMGITSVTALDENGSGGTTDMSWVDSSTAKHCVVGFVPAGVSNLPINALVWLDKGNGAGKEPQGWDLMSSAGQTLYIGAQRTDNGGTEITISPYLTTGCQYPPTDADETWTLYVAPWSQAVADSGVCPVSAVSCTFTMHKTGTPSATGISAYSAGPSTTMGPNADGAMYFSIPVTFKTPGMGPGGEPNCRGYIVTVQCVDSSGNPAPTDQGGVENVMAMPANDGTVWTPGPLLGEFNPVGSAYTYIRFKIYAPGLDISDSWNSGTRTLQTWQPSVNFGDAPTGAIPPSRLASGALNSTVTVHGSQINTAIPASIITSVTASVINGPIQASQIGGVYGSTITGTITASIIGTIAASEITGAIQASQIGTIAASQISGTISASNIGTIAASQITGVIVASQISTISASQLTGTIVASQIGSVNASTLTGSIAASVITTVNATALTGNIAASNITTVNATALTGNVAASNITSVNASVLTGYVAASNISSIAASAISGTIAASNIGSVSASSITGYIAASSISAINASVISGFIQSSNISSVAASAISGSIAASNIGTIAASSISGAIASSNITSVTASVINGVIVTSQLATQLLNSMSLMIPNGGFELPLSVGWAGSWNCAIQAYGANTGTNCVIMTCPVGSSAGLYQSGPPYTPCCPGDQFYAEIYAKSDSGVVSAPNFSIEFLDVNGTPISQSWVPVSPTATWKAYSVVGAAPAGACQVIVFVYNPTYDSHGSWYFDDVYACRVIGAAQISSVSASTINGLILANQISQISASTISGYIASSNISSVAASTISGAITASVIGYVAASGISGYIASSNISSIAASSITGTIASSNIGSIAASQIASIYASTISGKVQASQIGTINSSQISVVGNIVVGSIASALGVTYTGDSRASYVYPGVISIMNSSGIFPSINLNGIGPAVNILNPSTGAVLAEMDAQSGYGFMELCNSTGAWTVRADGNAGQVTAYIFDVTSPVSGSAGALQGYFLQYVNGAIYKVPYYAQI